MPLKTRHGQGAKDFRTTGEALLQKMARESSFIGHTWPEP